MDIQIAVLCDAATEYSGKLNILGAFDTVVTAQLPQCSIAIRMTFDKGEEGRHTVKLNLIDEDGRSIIPMIEFPLNIAVPEEAVFTSLNFIVNIQKLKFERSGLHSLEISVDGRREGNIPLHVRIPPATTKKVVND